MKKSFLLKVCILVAFCIFGGVAFAQMQEIEESKIAKTLQMNKNENAVFVCKMDLSSAVFNDDAMLLKQFAKAKLRIVYNGDKTNFTERAIYAGKNATVTFETRNLPAKEYEITKIEGIESLVQYRKRTRFENLTKDFVQVVIQESTNLADAEKAWLPSQIQDKLKSNLQEHLGMKTVVDANSEKALLKIQSLSESVTRDESTAIEIGKITNAKFAVFIKVRKTASGYTISTDFTDLTTGEQLASTTSKEYSKAEYLYCSTGAVDETTVSLASKLNIPMADLNKNLLTSGSASFSVDDQLALAKQNEENFRKQQAEYDEQIAKLSTSTDLNAVQNKKKLEAEKALLAQKQEAEKKRQAELVVQRQRAEEDARLDAERSIALKTQRDRMAQEAAAKAEQVRKIKMEKQGVLGQINLIEAKKKALVEIRQGVEARSQELYNQLVKDREAEEKRIRSKSFSTVELGSDGKPTEQAIARRENQVTKSYEDLTNKFFVDCEEVKQSTMAQQNALLAEIRTDQKNLAMTRTVSSMGEELKVSFGKYEGSKNGWNAYLSLYSDGVQLYTDSFIVGYAALSGKSAPNMTTELNDAVIEEYTNNVDMYSSLLARGDPIIYFEIDYNVTAESDDKPSEYKFSFQKVRVVNTVSGKVVQTSILNKILARTMTPQNDLRIFAGVCEKEKADFASEKYRAEVYMVKGMCRTDAEIKVAEDIRIENIFKNFGIEMIKIPNRRYEVLKTEVTQRLYIAVMGVNPSEIKGNNYPVTNLNWFSAIAFCNKLSEYCGLTPVYSVKGKTDVSKWGTKWEFNQDWNWKNDIKQNIDANGFRLLTTHEWKYAANDNYRIVDGRLFENRDSETHPVAQKSANSYGLYDISGNVAEWVWNPDEYGKGWYIFGCTDNRDPWQDWFWIGFRVCRTVDN